MEIHVPQWQFSDAGKPGNPDRLVLDLDPGEGAGLDACRTSADIAALAHEVALALEHDHPDQVVSRMGKDVRRGKVFIDWSQNWQDKTTIVPYSLQGRPTPTVAAPRQWDEIAAPGLAQLSYREVMERIDGGLVPEVPSPGSG